MGAFFVDNDANRCAEQVILWQEEKWNLTIQKKDMGLLYPIGQKIISMFTEHLFLAISPQISNQIKLFILKSSMENTVNKPLKFALAELIRPKKATKDRHVNNFTFSLS